MDFGAQNSIGEEFVYQAFHNRNVSMYVHISTGYSVGVSVLGRVSNPPRLGVTCVQMFFV